MKIYPILFMIMISYISIFSNRIDLSNIKELEKIEANLRTYSKDFKSLASYATKSARSKRDMEDMVIAAVEANFLMMVSLRCEGAADVVSNIRHTWVQLNGNYYCTGDSNSVDSGASLLITSIQLQSNQSYLKRIFQDIDGLLNRIKSSRALIKGEKMIELLRSVMAKTDIIFNDVSSEALRLGKQ